LFIDYEQTKVTLSNQRLIKRRPKAALAAIQSVSATSPVRLRLVIPEVVFDLEGAIRQESGKLQPEERRRYHAVVPDVSDYTPG
jgi:hypothetical protein